MIVLDASVVIAHFAITDSHAAEALEILDTEEELVIHPMNLAEALVRPAQTGSEVTASTHIKSIGIEPLASPMDEPLALARLRADTGLKLPDCCTLAAAIREGATLATFDVRLAAAGRAHGVEVVGVPTS
ncbi:type II toxin-antitoxin system VapC family toxin [Rathayibacter sp. CAU 1779]